MVDTELLSSLVGHLILTNLLPEDARELAVETLARQVTENSHGYVTPTEQLAASLFIAGELPGWEVGSRVKFTSTQRTETPPTGSVGVIKETYAIEGYYGSYAVAVVTFDGEDFHLRRDGPFKFDEVELLETSHATA